MVSSWLRSLFSPVKSELFRHSLRDYGYLLGNFLLGRKDGNTESETALERPSRCSKALKRSLEPKKEKVKVKPRRNLKDVEKILGYSFKNKSLLYQAFTHSSYSKNCESYERLEYVGDSVLNLMITVKQFTLYPDLPPGCLTPLRAANVDTEKLARVAVRHEFHKYLRHGKPIFSKQIQSFLFALPNYPLHSHGLIAAPKVLADIVESTIGAVFMDSNSSIDMTWEATKSLLEPIITPEMIQINPVTKLFEICQKHKLHVQLVDLWEEAGTYEVFVDNELRGRGACRAKKDVALNRAANAAYVEVVRTLGIS